MTTISDLIIAIRGDGSQFRNDLKNDQKQVNDLVRTMDGIHDAIATVTVKDDEAKANVEEIKRDMAEIRDKTARLDITTDEGKRKLEEYKIEMAALKDKVVGIRVEDTQAILAINNVRAELDSLHNKNVKADVTPGGGAAPGGGGGILGGLVMSALPLASPVGAAGVGGIMGLASAFSAATAGAVGFGAVAIPTFKNLADEQKAITKAQGAVNNATTSKQKAAALKQLSAAWAGVSTEQKQALASMHSFDNFWGKFASDFQKPILQMFINGMGILKTLLTDFKPVIQEATFAFQGLIGMFKQSLGTPPIKQFFQYLAKDAGPLLFMFGQMFGNVMKGIMALLVDFGPLGMSMTQGLLKMSQAFAEWASNVGRTRGFKEFIDYVKQNGPKLLAIIGNVAVVIKNLLVGMAPLGAQMLTVIQQFTKWLATFTTLHPQITKLIGELIAGAGGLSLLSKALSPVLTGFLSGIKGVKGFTQALIKSPGAIKKFMTDTIGLGKNMVKAGKSFLDTSRLVLMYGKDMVKAAADGVVSAAKLQASYIKTMIRSGKESVVAGGRIVKNFIAKVIESGKQAVINGARIAKGFTKSVIDVGKQAAVNGAKLAKSLTAKVISLGKEAVTAGAKMAKNLTTAVIEAGKRAISTSINFAKLTAKLVAQAVQWTILKARVIAFSAVSKIAAAAQWLLNAALDANPIGIVILAVAALALGIYELITHFKSVRTWVIDAWNHIKQFGHIAGNVLGGLGSLAYHWGANMLHGFVGGIESMIGRVRNAVGNVMHAAARLIGFHSPSEEGEGRHIVEWGENMIHGFTDGITKAIPHLRSVMDGVIQAPNLAVSSNVAQMVNGSLSSRPPFSSQRGMNSNHYHNDRYSFNISLPNATVRSDEDIKNIAYQLKLLQDKTMRAQGVITG